MSPQTSAIRRRRHPISTLLRGGATLLPTPVQRFGLEAVLGRLLRSRIEAGDLAFLEGRVLCVEISDLGWRWPLTLAGGSLVCLPPSSRSDVVIRGHAKAFLKLALRHADPDTVFFQRWLTIVGDTELGLAAKNFLDSVEWEQWLILRHAPQWTGLKERLQP